MTSVGIILFTLSLLGKTTQTETRLSSIVVDDAAEIAKSSSSRRRGTAQGSGSRGIRQMTAYNYTSDPPGVITSERYWGGGLIKSCSAAISSQLKARSCSINTRVDLGIGSTWNH